MSESTYLFAIPSVAEGVGRILDFGNALTGYNYARTPADADAIATYMDWSAVGGDIRQAIDQARAELATS